MLLRCFGVLNRTTYLHTALPLITRCFYAKQSQAATHRVKLSDLTLTTLSLGYDPASSANTSSNSTASHEVSDVAFQEQISRSFVKVPLPAEGVLRQIVVAAPEEPTDLHLRAYHVGSRVHIGRVLSDLSHLFPSCRTTAGKDYAIIWLDDIPAVPVPTTAHTVLKVRESLGWLQNKLRRSMKPQGERSWRVRLPTGQGAPSLTQQTADNKSAQAKSAWNLQHFTPPSKQRSELVTVSQLAPDTAPLNSLHLHPQLTAALQLKKQLQPPFMAVYRSGSVVFGGLSEREEVLWMSHLVPPSVRYSGGHSSMWAAAKGSSVPSVVFQDSLKVVIDASSPAYAAKGIDQVQLRVLDVGGVRVLTSVLAQSAAMRFYEESVKHSLVQLASWRAALLASRAGGRAGAWSSGRLSSFSVKDVIFGSGHKQDKVLFKVIAASALIINEAQQLLEVAEPAWQYDDYNKIWELMAEDQQLEARLTNLETKLHQVETEAKHDVNVRAERRRMKLNQRIIALLVVSCFMAAVGFLSPTTHHKAPAETDSNDEAVVCAS